MSKATAQVHAIAGGIGDRYRATVYVGAGCGLRNGEALGLEVDHGYVLRREVYVVQQLVVQSKVRTPYGPPADPPDHLVACTWLPGKGGGRAPRGHRRPCAASPRC